MLDLNLTVTTNQKPTKRYIKNKKKGTQTKHSRKPAHYKGRDQRKKKTENYKNNLKKIKEEKKGNKHLI